MLDKLRNEWNKSNKNKNYKAHRQGDRVVIKNTKTGEIVKDLTPEIVRAKRYQYPQRVIKDPSEVAPDENLIMIARKKKGNQSYYNKFKKDGTITTNDIHKIGKYSNNKDAIKSTRKSTKKKK